VSSAASHAGLGQRDAHPYLWQLALLVTGWPGSEYKSGPKGA